MVDSMQAMDDEESVALSLSARAWQSLEQAARCLGLSRAEARDVATASMLSIDGQRIFVLESPPDIQVSTCTLMLVARLDMLDIHSVDMLRLILQANVHAAMCLGASAAMDDGGRLLLALPLHIELYDPPSLASMLMRFGAMARQFAELTPPLQH